MRLLLLIPALLFLIAGHGMLASATQIAIRRNNSVWKTAMPEFGGAVLSYSLAALFAALAGGAL
ncbi:hypothetical protein LB553_01235 [Mesorhizobium sp. CA8]|uniref:hypothetical protein n=1 Tax=Mesorhizobium sp. CA8 TaxID=2876637 RepID=UPI001CC978A1|nr:hypothetical protein [Mesorhizobium sp. CA8]MBZ9759510.1 hypothetical protein [Mesorhizobium sp. CA8]